MWFRRRPFGAWRRPLFWRPVRPLRPRGFGMGWGCGGLLVVTIAVAFGMLALRLLARGMFVHALLR